MNPAAFPLAGTLYHPALGQVQYEITEVSDDPDEQVEATAGLMRQYAQADAQTAQLHADVAQAWQSADPLADTWEYLRRHGRRGMTFIKDEATGQPFEASQGPIPPFRWRPVVETLIRPADQAVLSNPQGDCDDFAMYGAAHLTARGVPCAYATVAADEQQPELYTHVYLIAYPDSGPYAGQRVPMDLSHGPYLGWEVPGAQYRKYAEWPIGSGCSLFTLGLLAGGAYLIYRALAKGRQN